MIGFRAYLTEFVQIGPIRLGGRPWKEQVRKLAQKTGQKIFLGTGRQGRLVQKVHVGGRHRPYLDWVALFANARELPGGSSFGKMRAPKPLKPSRRRVAGFKKKGGHGLRRGRRTL